MTLCEKTRHLLKNRPSPQTFPLIETETGISVEWLSKFNTGKIENPSVNTIQKLYEFLTNKTLDVEG